MFKALGSAFLDTFRRPFVLLFLFFSIVLGILAYGWIYSYTEPYLFNSSDLLANTLSILTNHLWVALIYLGMFILISYFAALYISYIVNKKTGSKESFKGVLKIFWFNLFLALITYVPIYVILFFGINLITVLLFILLTLIYIFIVYPFLFFVPILLPSLHLNEALTKSYGFAKKHYGWLIISQILFVVALTVLSSIVDLFTLIDEFLGLLLFIIIFAILALWALNFIYNWFYSE